MLYSENFQLPCKNNYIQHLGDMLKRYGDLLYEKRFSLNLKGVAYKNYVKSESLYGNEEWCLRDNQAIILWIAT